MQVCMFMVSSGFSELSNLNGTGRFWFPLKRHRSYLDYIRYDMYVFDIYMEPFEISLRHWFQLLTQLLSLCNVTINVASYAILSYYPNFTLIFTPLQCVSPRINQIHQRHFTVSSHFICFHRIWVLARFYEDAEFIRWYTHTYITCTRQTKCFTRGKHFISPLVLITVI